MSWGPSRDLWGPRLHPAMSSVLVGGNCRNILFPVLSTVAEYAFSSHVYGSIFLVQEDEERAKSVLELYLLASWRRRLHPFVADGEFFTQMSSRRLVFVRLQAVLLREDIYLVLVLPVRCFANPLERQQQIVAASCHVAREVCAQSSSDFNPVASWRFGRSPIVDLRRGEACVARRGHHTSTRVLHLLRFRGLLWTVSS